MSSGGGDFRDPLEDLLREAKGLSDEDLERYLSGNPPGQGASDEASTLEAGTRVEGTVVEVRADEVLLELSGKMYGVVDISEFDEDRPVAGQRMAATFERHDRARDLAILSVRGVRREITFEGLRPGVIVEALVTATNKGGLSLEIRGIPAFMPVSQIDRGPVEDPGVLVGRKVRCQVLSSDSSRREVVVSRRAVLDMEAEADRDRAISTLTEGQVLTGTVVRVNDAGAFVDVGGAVGLIPAQKLRSRGGPREEAIRDGRRLEVQVVRVDRERKRISLDLRKLAADSWGTAATHYAPGDHVTGWVSGRDPEGLILSIEEGVVGLLPSEALLLFEDPPRPGAVLKVEVSAVDPVKRRLVLRPVQGST